MPNDRTVTVSYDVLDAFFDAIELLIEQGRSGPSATYIGSWDLVERAVDHLDTARYALDADPQQTCPKCGETSGPPREGS